MNVYAHREKVGGVTRIGILVWRRVTKFGMLKMLFHRLFSILV